MRVRVRVAEPGGSNQTHKIDVNEDDGFDQLRASLESIGLTHVDWDNAEFSLNNKEPIDSSCSLRAAGIGPGDLLFVLDGTQKTASGPTRAPTDASSAVVSRRVTDPITAALLPRLGTELAAVSLCVSAVGPNPEEYRAAAVFVACHAVLTQAGLTAVQGNAWPDRWWAAPHCGYGKHYVHPHLPGAASTVRCVSFGSVFVLSAIAMSDGQGEKDTSPPSRPHVLVAQIEPTKYVRVVPSRAPVGLEVYTALPLLVRVLRDRLETPLLNMMRNIAGFPQQGCLDALSPELKLLILSYLDPVSLCHVAQVSRSFRDIAEVDTLWKAWAVLPDGQPPFKNVVRLEWMRRRVDAHARERRAQLLEAQRLSWTRGHRFNDDRPLWLPPGGIVGGDHDLGILEPRRPAPHGPSVPFGDLRDPFVGGGVFPSPRGPARWHFGNF